jgi:DNA replication and repair protein RecF
VNNLFAQNLSLRLINWKIFADSTFMLSNKNFIIADKNGIGKSSILFGLYTLLSGKPWPNTKLGDHIHKNSQYFSIGSKELNSYISGELSNNNKFKINHHISPLFENQLPKIITYQPEDNYWLSLSRQKKIEILDQLIEIEHSKVYTLLLKRLSKFLRQKQMLIKSKCEDWLIIDTTNKHIFELSIQIWAFRYDYLIKVCQNYSEFAELIEKNNHKIKLNYLKSNLSGIRLPSQYIEMNEDKFILEARKLWSIECLSGRILFGAQRDDFEIYINNTLINQFLSRGENRLFIIWIKSKTTYSSKQRDSKKSIFLGDDILNELDNTREKFIIEYITPYFDQFILTSNFPKPHIEIPDYTLDDMLSI